MIKYKGKVEVLITGGEFEFEVDDDEEFTEEEMHEIALEHALNLIGVSFEEVK